MTSDLETRPQWAVLRSAPRSRPYIPLSRDIPDRAAEDQLIRSGHVDPTAASKEGRSGRALVQVIAGERARLSR